MPELPEVDNVVTSLQEVLQGRLFADIDIKYSGIIKDENAFLSLLGKEIKNVRRRGKYIIIEFSEVSLLVHLRMTGKLLYDGVKDKHTHIIITLDDGKELTYNDVRKFGTIEVIDNDAVELYLQTKLGMEPLTMDCAKFKESIKRRNRAIKNVLLDQTIVCGLGNIYCDEVLFRSGINPEKIASEIEKKDLDTLCVVIKSVLQDAIAKGGSSIKDYVDGSGKKGSYQKEHQVYGRYGKPCLKCGLQLSKTVVAGRTTIYCENCQK